MGNIRVGTCSWTEKTLIESGEFYPRGANTAEARLRHYASQFDTVEVDSAYYAIPSEKNTSLWAERTPEGFIFHVKVYGALTGHGINPKTLPVEIRELLREADKVEASIHVKDAPLLEAIFSAFIRSLKPLRDAGRLGLLIYQFPPWFHYKKESMDYILMCREHSAGLPMAVEFRHASWLTGAHAEQSISFLRDNGITYVTADEPQYGTAVTAPFYPEATTDIAYLRLHGRNRENWLKKGVETTERYDYLYSDGELEGFAGVARDLSLKAELTYIMFNNCHLGFAVKNALTIKRMLAVS